MKGKTNQDNRVGSEDRKCDVQGRTNGGLGTESRRRTGVRPKDRTGVRRSELMLHKVVTLFLLVPPSFLLLPPRSFLFLHPSSLFLLLPPCSSLFPLVPPPSSMVLPVPPCSSLFLLLPPPFTGFFLCFTWNSFAYNILIKLFYVRFDSDFLYIFMQ